jgi:dienelactone hydrolase
MAHIALFHSVLGLRPVEVEAADRLRAAGHDVVTPDLYAGQTASTLDGGFAIKDRVGWDTITQRAFDAVRDLPADAVLVGVSMGAGVVGAVLPQRPETARVLLVHGLADIPSNARHGLPVQVHVSDSDDLFPPAAVTAWLAAMNGVDVDVFTYQDAGHFYTDASLPDHNEQAASLTWQRALEFLEP